MELISAVAVGLVLAAAAGLRAFLPVFAAGVAARLLELPLPETLGWLAATESLVIFGVATLLEVLGDKIPIVDHLLDSVQTLSKPVLAVLAAAPFLYQAAPGYAFALAVILGAPVALGVHATKAAVRVGSSATTAGVGNPLLSIAEDVIAVGSVALAFLAPLVALLLMGLLVLALLRLARARRRAPPRRPA